MVLARRQTLILAHLLTIQATAVTMPEIPAAAPMSHQRRYR
jgi:hypothetical protein